MMELYTPMKIAFGIFTSSGQVRQIEVTVNSWRINCMERSSSWDSGGWSLSY